MAKINPQEYGSGGERKAPLTPDVLGGADVAVLTIDNVRTNLSVADGRKAALLEFREQPEHVLWLNKTGISALVSRLGDETDEWIGQRVPLVRVRVNNPSTGRMVTKYQVADPDDWDDLLSEAARRRGRSARSRRGRK